MKLKNKRGDFLDTAEVTKDSGYSWIILGAGFLIQTIIFGLLFCFGIYFVTLLDYFQCTKTEVALVGFIGYATKCLTGLVSSLLYRKLGCRAVVMTGGLISAFGCFVSYFAKSMIHLYLGYGVINGFGLGLVYTPTLGILPDYFQKHRYFAVGFVTVGSGVGTMLFQPIFLFLINTYGWRGSMLINSGISLHIVLLGSLMKSRTMDKHLKFSNLLEIELFKNLKFCLLLLDTFLWGGSIFIVFSMINGLMMKHGISKESTTLLVPFLGVGSILGRLISSIVGNYSQTNRPLFYALSTFMFGLAAWALTYCYASATFGLVLVIYGFSFGCMLSQLAGVIIDLAGIEKLVNGVGYAMFADGFGLIIISLVAGVVADNFGIERAYHFSSGLASLAALLCFCNVFLRYFDEKHKTIKGMEFKI